MNDVQLAKAPTQALWLFIGLMVIGSFPKTALLVLAIVLALIAGGIWIW